MSAVLSEEKKDQAKPDKSPDKRPQAPYAEPHGYIEASSDFEQMDRGDGWGIDDIKTYHRTEK